METAVKPDGTQFALYYFDFDGYKFVSKVRMDSDMYKRVSNVPEHYFVLMNKDCLAELVGTGKSLEQIKAKLYEINKGGSSAIIELADE